MFANALLIAVAVLAAILVGLVARRVLGVPIGYIRSIIVGALVVVSSTTKTAKVECYVETGRLVRKATVTPQRSGTAHICGATPALS